MRHLVALGLVALGACGPSQPQLTPSNAPQTSRIHMDHGVSTTVHDINLVGADRTVTSTVAAPRDRTWQALLPLFAELGLPVTSLDEARFAAGSDAEVRRRFLGSPLATFLDCGSGAASRAPRANSYEVRMRVSTVLRSLPDGTTEIQLLVTGNARDPVHAGPPLPCSSTGRLEQRIVGDVNRRVTAG